MFLKSLEMHGFKSFADKTLLDFHEGVTGIVGPNGCGKSNIVDAMRWVLGETSAKALRGGEMADVIFNGTDRRSPLGMAEVTLTLGGCEGVLDTDFDEVSIGRRVFRDGKGEYLLNKQPCRLKDIHNLLMDTGIGRTSYSIMEQGKIDMLLSSKPEDRRMVFEEAAGITKYKAQKKEALRKLDYTEANLVRIRDIVSENERQIKSLSRQASKAKRYQNLHDDVKTLDLHLSHKQWRELRAEKSELNTSIRSLRLEQDNIEDSIDNRQAQMASARYEYQEIENRITELQSILARLESEISTSRNRIEFNVEREHEQTTLIRKNKDEITVTREKESRQQAEIDQADVQLQEVLQRIEEQQRQVEEEEAATQAARDNREALNAQHRELEEERSQLKSRSAALEATIETSEEEFSSSQQRLTRVEEEITRISAEKEERTKDAAELKSKIDAHLDAISRFEENLAVSEKKYYQAKNAASAMQEALSSLFQLHSEKRARLDTLRQFVESGEGLEKGTRAVLQDLGESDDFREGIKGPLNESIQVKGENAEAIEAALGRRLQAVLVKDLNTAEEVISALNSDNLGKASLIAADALQNSDLLDKRGRPPLGAIGWASDYVECQDESLRPLIGQLLGLILIAPDLHTALRLRKKSSEFDIVTQSGEYVSREGIIEGGKSSGEGSSLLKKQSEIQELEELASTLHSEVDSRQLRRDELMDRVDQFEGILAEARERLQQKRLSSSSLDGKYGVLERDLNQLDSKLENLQWEKSELLERETRIDAQLTKNRQERDLSLRQIETVDEQMDGISVQLAAARASEEGLTDRVTEARTSLAVEKGTQRNIEEQMAPMVQRLQESKETIEKRELEIADFEQRIARGQAETAELQEKISQWEVEITERQTENETILAERSTYNEKIEAGESELTKMRKEVQNVADRRGKEEVKVAQFDINIENLEKSCRERYRTELEMFEPDSHTLLAVIETQKDNARRKNSKAPKPREWREEKLEQGSAENPEAAENGSDAADENLVSFIPAESSEANEEEFEEIDIDPAEPDWDFVVETVAFLRTRLDSMGPVNLDAISEFDELEEHFQFNLRQLEDLENSKEELLRMIAKINRETRKMFADTFEKIRKNFRDMFKELFGDKAKADLVLMDDEDPLECGIDIIAKPPGKKLQSISLLSGGERSMTAVALLFAIYMVKPSPFCVLDELDAPLDESNITRFIRVLDRFIGDSQFVIVTHSKRTMSRADVMYGVSMQEFGVSKTVGVKFSNAEEQTADSKVAGIGG